MDMSATRLRKKKSNHTIKFSLAIEVSLVEELHGNLLLPSVPLLELGVGDSDVVFNILAGEGDLLVAP